MTLTDTQTILLSHAAQRESGSLYPQPAPITAPAGGVAKSVASLVKRGMAEEREASDATSVARSDGDLRYGVYITAVGKAAIGVENDDEAGDSVPAKVAAPAAPRATKSAAVVALLRRGQGATLAELIAATGWLPHTTRAALTGLRKKGHTIERSQRGDDSCYRIVAA